MNATVRQGAWKRERSDDKELEDLLKEIRDRLNQTYRTVVSVQTTDAVATTLWTEEVTPSSVWDVELVIVAKATDGSAAAYRRVSRFNRSGTAAPTVLVTDTYGTDYEDVAGWAVTIDVNGDDARLRVTGDAARTVDWAASVRVQQAPKP